MFAPVSGTLPSEIGRLSTLANLAAISTRLSGTIPTEVGQLSGLVGLGVSSVSVSGTIPTELGSLSLLNFAVERTSISGTIPTELASTNNSFVLSRNPALSGTIPSQVGLLSRLALYIEFYSTSLSGTLPSELGVLTAAAADLMLGRNYVSGALPTELGQLSTLPVLDLTDMRLDYPTDASGKEALSVATQRCGTTTTCAGVPPASCSSFGQYYRPVIGAPRECTKCDFPLWLLRLLVGLLVAMLLGGAVVFVRLLQRHPRWLKRWLATASILIGHVQALSILGRLSLHWPPAVRALISAIGLDLLRLPSFSCLFDDGGSDNQACRRLAWTCFTSGFRVAGGSTQSWLFPLLVCGGALGLLLALIGAALAARACRNEALADSTELALSAAFALPLTATWHSCMSLLSLVLDAPATLEGLMSVRNGGYSPRFAVAAFDDAIRRLDSYKGLGIAFVVSLLTLQLLLAAHFARRIHMLSRATRHLAATTAHPSVERSWPSAMPPRRLSRVCAYLCGRFARHALRWELVIWARLVALEAIVAMLDFMLRHTTAPASRNAARYSMAAAAFAILLLAWWLQQRHRPYAFRTQNVLAAWVLVADISILLLTCVYSILQQQGPAPWVADLLAALMLLLLLGSLASATLVIVRSARETIRAFETVDRSAAMTVADTTIDRPLAARLLDRTVRLVRIEWLLNEQLSNAALPIDPTSGRHTFAPQQELPEEVFVPPEEAVDLFNRGDRSIVALSHPWITAGHPDPHGTTLLAVRQCVRPLACEAIFIDFMSLPQMRGGKPRTAAEQEQFARGLDVMGSFYASLTGTVVLQHQRVLVPETGREATTDAGRAEYNSTPYATRGWCLFEQGVSRAAAAHLAKLLARGVQLPERLARACELPKVRVVEGGVAVIFESTQTPTQVLQQAAHAIPNARFVGSGDREEVLRMLQEIEYALKMGIDEQLERMAASELEPDPAQLRRERLAKRVRDDGAEMLQLEYSTSSATVAAGRI